jgi:LCP family protein required for cell wall assembly
MSLELPPDTQDAETTEPDSMGPGGNRRVLWLVAVLVFFGASVYLALVLVMRVDGFLVPGTDVRPGPVLSQLPFVSPNQSEPTIGTERITILVLGVDTRPGQSDEVPSRTDVMFLLILDPSTKSAGILGIPRDMWVSVPGHGQGRINEAFTDGGPELAIRTVTSNLGIPIQHYAIINFGAFTQFIDDVGGIDINVPTRIYQEDYSPEDLPYHFTPKDFKPGWQHMNGEDALAYARIRIGSSDLDRIDRQQLILNAVLNKATDLRLAPIAFDLWQRYRSTITTDISDLRAAGLARLATLIGPSRVVALSLAPAMRDCTWYGAQVLCWEQADVRSIVTSLYLDPAIRAEQATIEVQPGSAPPSMTARVISSLASHGISTSNLATGLQQENEFQQTVIVDFGGKPNTSLQIAQWLGVSPSRIRTVVDGTNEFGAQGAADIVVILGQDIILPPQARTSFR